jgi:hypothetical protein
MAGFGFVLELSFTGFRQQSPAAEHFFLSLPAGEPV